MFLSPLGRALGTLGFVVMLHGVVRAAHVPSRVYTTTDGLAHNVVNRIVGDSRGYFWFCTREGLSRFDGSTFVTYRDRTRPRRRRDHRLPGDAERPLLGRHQPRAHALRPDGASVAGSARGR